MQSRQDYRVLLPVANPEHVEQLASLAAALAQANEGQVLALHVQGDPSAVGAEFHTVLKRAEQIVAQTGVPVHAHGQSGTRCRLGHSGDRARNRGGCHRHGLATLPAAAAHARATARLDGLDPLLADPPCDILILRAEHSTSARHILVPLSRSAQISGGLAARASIGRVVGWTGHCHHGRGRACHRSGACRRCQDAARGVGKVCGASSSDSAGCRRAQPVDGIVQQAAAHDLIMLDTSQEGVVACGYMISPH